MTSSRQNDQVGDVPLLFLFTLAHAAVAFPTLRLWAEYCSRRKRTRP